MRKVCIFIIGIFITFLGRTQDVSFTVSAPSEVATGQAFQIEFTLKNAQGNNLKAPAFKGMDLHWGPRVSNMQNMQSINGRTTIQSSQSFIYQGAYPKEGIYNIGSASIDVDGKTYKTDPFNIKVVKGSSNTSNLSRGGSASRSSESDQPATTTIKSDDLYIKTFVSDANPYIGEPIIITYKIYTSVNVAQYQIFKRPSNKGFWIEDLSNNSQQVENKTEVINGKRYITAELQKMIAYPQESGKLTLDPLEVEAIAQIQTQPKSSGDPFWDFFNSGFGNVQNIKKNLKSNPTTINVKSLPEQGKPDNFNNYVGNFSISSKLDKTELKAHEAATLKISISGQGNINLIDPPFIDFSNDFEVYDPKTSENISKNVTGITGSKTFEYIIIPKNEGNYTIPKVEFSYFNPNTGKYNTIYTSEHPLKVLKGDGKFISNTGIAQENVKLLNRDIEYIYTKPLLLKEKGKLFFLSTTYFILLVLPLLIAGILYFLNKNRVKQQSDVVGMKNKRALKMSKKCLKKAEQFMKSEQKDAFYIEISQALWGFLSNRFNIPIAELSIDSASQALSAKNVKQETIERFIKTLEHCEYERFAPEGNSRQTMNEIYQEALVVIYDTVKSEE